LSFTNEGDDQSLRHIISLVRFAISCAKMSICTSSTPVLILSDAFEMPTIDRCRDLFNFVEESVPIWVSDFFFASCKNHLLRMCNDIIRRLSKLQNTIFSGRIQLFLARLFPLEEKSALNLMSHFNTENVTTFKKDKNDNGLASKNDGDSMDTEEGELPTSNPIDFELYSKLWSLQEYFSNPTKCYTAIGWRNLKVDTAQVLKTFSSYKLEYVERRKKDADQKSNLTITDIIKEHGRDHQYFPKFLTNENLMDLQLSDSNFRRHLLVQYLILFQYLTCNTKPNQTLNEQQHQWVGETKSKVISLLSEIPPDGEKFANNIKHVLKREENWINWKNEGCPSFATKEEDVVVKRTRKQSIGDELAYSTKSAKLDLGSSELTRLWNICPDNLEACKAENRTKFLPTLQEFFEEAIEQADPEAGIEEQYKLVKNSEFGWRALRLLSRRSFNFFTPSNQPFKPLSDYLSYAVSQVARDLAANQTAKETEERTVTSTDKNSGD